MKIRNIAALLVCLAFLVCCLSSCGILEQLIKIETGDADQTTGPDETGEPDSETADPADTTDDGTKAPDGQDTEGETEGDDPEETTADVVTAQRVDPDETDPPIIDQGTEVAPPIEDVTTAPVIPDVTTVTSAPETDPVTTAADTEEDPFDEPEDIGLSLEDYEL